MAFFFTSNLLQPSGVMLRPAIFSLKVYRAEDIPQSENMFFNIITWLFSNFFQLFESNQYLPFTVFLVPNF